HAGWSPDSGHSERSAGRARPRARLGVTVPDGHRIRVIPSAARNLTARSEESEIHWQAHPALALLYAHVHPDD
ncbi:hypothetical protein, partial [Roseiflexus castenholzii]|uniref:hypothetical protein n=1 Tax=Roseiflexus castenholzii TaxID=120962 RepID=UPI003C7AE065